jgi:hypothetical protein
MVILVRRWLANRYFVDLGFLLDSEQSDCIFSMSEFRCHQPSEYKQGYSISQVNKVPLQWLAEELSHEAPPSRE